MMAGKYAGGGGGSIFPAPVHKCRLLTNVVSTITDVGRYFVHTLAIQKCHLLSERTGQLLVDGSDNGNN